MNVRKNARLTPRGRLLLVRRRRGAGRPQLGPATLQASAENLITFVSVPVRRQLQQESRPAPPRQPI
jgi:hypothetical protein